MDSITKNKYIIGLLQFALFFLFNYLVYKHFLQHFFYSDDFYWLRYGELVKDDIFNVFRLRVTSFFSPVVNFYFFLGQTFFPLSSWSYHLFGIFLHSLNTYLLFVLIQKILKQKTASLFAALFFAVASYHYEAVIWISAIMHVLVTLFILLGLLGFYRYHESKKLIFLFLSLVCGFVAFFTKENGIVFVPAVFLLAIFLERKNIFQKEKILPLIPYAVLLLGLLFYTYHAQKNSMWIANGVYNIHPKAVYPLAASMFGLFDFEFATYIVKHPLRLATLSFATIFATFFCWYLLKKKEVEVFVLGMALALLGFLPVMFFYFGTWRQVSQQRYSYLPSVGAALMVAALLAFFLKQFEKKRFLQILLLVLMTWNISSNIRYNIFQYKKEFVIVSRQSRGMVDSFRTLQAELTPVKNIVLVAPFPFFGNEYYRYMYQYFVYRGKDLEDWRSVRSPKDVDTSRELSRGQPLFLFWDNKNMKFEIHK